MPQRRRRTYIVGYKKDSIVAKQIEDANNWLFYDGVLAKSFPFVQKKTTITQFEIEGTIKEVSDNFNKGKKDSPFGTAGIMIDRNILSVDSVAVYDGPIQTLGDILVNEEFVPEEFYISEEELPK
jgi:DNA (cytosine-5)-methyltransferase 1